MVQPTPAVSAGPPWPLVISGLATPLIALFAIYAVHWLTKARDREKLVFELHKSIGETATGAKALILTAWSEKDSAKRIAAIAQTKWKLQQLGGLAERLRRISSRRRWRRSRRGVPWFQKVEVTLIGDMALLRDTITADPFEDPERPADANMGDSIEQAIGGFLQAVDEALLGWMD